MGAIGGGGVCEMGVVGRGGGGVEERAGGGRKGNMVGVAVSGYRVSATHCYRPRYLHVHVCTCQNKGKGDIAKNPPRGRKAIYRLSLCQ